MKQATPYIIFFVLIVFFILGTIVGYHSAYNELKKKQKETTIKCQTHEGNTDSLYYYRSHINGVYKLK